MKSDPNQVNRKIFERGWREAGQKRTVDEETKRAVKECFSR